jgi:hypothetical protein
MRKFLLDLAERAGRTFLQGAIGALPPAAALTDWGAVKVAGVAAATGGVAALGSMLMSVLAGFVGDRTSASLLSATSPEGQ